MQNTNIFTATSQVWEETCKFYKKTHKFWMKLKKNLEFGITNVWGNLTSLSSNKFSIPLLEQSSFLFLLVLLNGITNNTYISYHVWVDDMRHLVVVEPWFPGAAGVWAEQSPESGPAQPYRPPQITRVRKYHHHQKTFVIKRIFKLKFW